jgi:hypothetical protein
MANVVHEGDKRRRRDEHRVARRDKAAAYFAVASRMVAVTGIRLATTIRSAPFSFARRFVDGFNVE